MAHRHLILAYVFTILVQLGYAGWIGLKYRETRKLERRIPPVPCQRKIGAFFSPSGRQPSGHMGRGRRFPYLFAHQLPGMTSSQQLFFRLNVHQDLGDLVHLLPHLVGDGVCDEVPLADREIAAHHYMQIHVVAEAHLTDKALFHPKDPRHRFGHTADVLFNLRRGRRVQQLGYRATELLPAPQKDHRSGAQGGPVVGRRDRRSRARPRSRQRQTPR